jgi:alkanesulfonate monooxygenase SsuD/methylene tetrahydromethanopterin reductase-like flavin-dependent oxidoreductase (luciferase family)
MDNAGANGPDPYGRRFTPQEYAELYHALVEWSKLADKHGLEHLWLTEHHFQREGQQIIPNVILVAAILAQHTRRLKIGAFFHQVPTWHPVRLAEDFAVADIMSGGRVLLGVGRGSVMREAISFGAGFGRGGDAGDTKNRDLFDEQMDLLRLALTADEWSFKGEHYEIPAPGLTNTGGLNAKPWDKVGLVPMPVHPWRIYQPVTSEPTFHACAKHGHIGVVPYFNRTRSLPRWKMYGDLCEQYQNRKLRPGEDRLLVLQVHIGDTHEQAVERFRPAHDERMRFLAEQRPIPGYFDESGQPYPIGRSPSLEDSMTQANWLVGTADEVRDQLVGIVKDFGVEELAVEIGFSGLSKDEVSEQIERFATEVRPALGA